MSEAKVNMTEVERRTLDGAMRHRQAYLDSGGRLGHIMDFTGVGGPSFVTTLLLETVGRHSGERRITPLVYGDIGGEVVIVASKGGADIHPGWYWNLREMGEVTIQIATQAFRASWREPEGAEHAKIWEFITDVFPPYRAYQAATTRRIPVVMFQPGATVEVLKA